MQGSNTIEQAKAIKEKLDQLHKNKTWRLIYNSKNEPVIEHWEINQYIR